MSQSDLPDDPRFLIASSQGPREEQQDAAICLHDDAQGTALLVVGDGVGGRSGGRIASQKVAELAVELWEERNGHLVHPEKDLASLCQVAHEHINSEGSNLGLSPRTTIVALYLTPTHASWVHSGDSRLYHFRAGQLVERTEDHSLLEIMVQRGAVKEEDMGNHPDQGTLLQSLGGEEYAEPSAGASAITPGDAFLLCTDGFWERTKPEEMLELVFADSAAARPLLTQAVERAIERNGPKGDNVTVVLALPARHIRAVPPGARSHVRLLLAAAILLSAVAAILWCWPGGRKDATVILAPAPAGANAKREVPTNTTAAPPEGGTLPKPQEGRLDDPKGAGPRDRVKPAD